MRRVHVAGTALWTPGFDTVGAWLEGTSDPAIVAPVARFVGPRVRRATSLTTRMQLQVAERAGTMAGLDLSSVTTVFGSALGEIDIALMQMDMMREGDGVMSPARFKNSVHNTGSGIFGIAASNHGFTTAVAAGAGTLAAVMLEAWALLDEGHDAVLAVVADEAPPPPLDRFSRYGPLAGAVALRTAPGAGDLATLRALRADAAPRNPAPAAPDLPPDLRHNPCAAFLPLLAAIHGRGAISVDLAPPPYPPRAVDVHPLT